MSWALNMYGSVSNILYPELRRERSLEFMNLHEIVGNNALMHEIDVCRAYRDIIAKFVAVYFCADFASLVDISNMCMYCMEIYDLTKPTMHTMVELLSHLLEVQIPSLRTVNAVISGAFIDERLELERKQRINLKLDKNMFLYLGVRQELHPFIIEPKTFESWFSNAVRCFNAGQNIQDSLSNTTPEQPRLLRGLVDKYREKLAGLKWRTRRKRRRKPLSETRGHCGICFEDKLVVETKCEHHFCRTCIDAWNSNKCPICRTNKYI